MNIEEHPCFNEEARHRTGRIHLPVAPKCNMQCNYCERRFDCVNESRPGVTSTLLAPDRACAYLEEVLERTGNISVVGIAGPGDPFANAAETLQTLRLVRERYPDIILCVATNGLELLPHVEELAGLKVSHVTITANAVDPAVGAGIYAWARLDRKIYRGADAASLLIERQAAAIRRLKELKMIVKINTVVINGVNDHHAADIARRMAELGADIQNCIPLYHVANTPFEEITPISSRDMESIRTEAAQFLPQMSHCSRCRADAVGLLGAPMDRAIEELLIKVSRSGASGERSFVAAASMEGLLVNRHMGETSSLWIYGVDGGQAMLVDRRQAPPRGQGDDRWMEMAVLLHDCSTVLVSGVGERPRAILEKSGIRVIVMEGLIAEGVESLLAGKDIPKILLRTPGRCGIGQSCGGTGTGCG